MSMTRLAGRTAVVTGGAAGIGAATVRRLAAEGATVAVADLDEAGAKQLATEVGGLGLALDVADTDAVHTAFATVAEAFGRIDILVNNAGGDRTAFFVDTTPADWDHWLAVNLRGTMACTHAVLPGMQERRGGAIVNVASEAGRAGLGAGATYSAAKAACSGSRRRSPARGRGSGCAATRSRRAGTPDEVAAGIAFLASDDASFITGHTLSISGGGYVS